jgi:uncharacterized protein YdcH (DUF465 family)
MTEKEQRYFEVLMEEMNGKFSLVLEGHDAIRHEFKEQIDEIKEEQQLFKSLLKGSHDELKSEIQGVRTDLKEEIQGVRTELRETREDLSVRIEAVGTKVDGHEDRIRFLERKVA